SRGAQPDVALVGRLRCLAPDPVRLAHGHRATHNLGAIRHRFSLPALPGDGTAPPEHLARRCLAAIAPRDKRCTIPGQEWYVISFTPVTPYFTTTFSCFTSAATT